jgi:hypothetical protein
MASDEELRGLWQGQHTGDAPDLQQTRAEVERIERAMRRGRIDGYIALAFIAAGLVTVTILFANALLIAGTVSSLCGFAFLLYEVRDHHRRAPAAADGDKASVEYHRDLLRHRMEFHRRRLWLRVAALAPGGVLYFLGFAMARPDLAPFIYLELATFAVALALIVPMNRRAAAKLERQIEQLERLR